MCETNFPLFKNLSSIEKTSNSQEVSPSRRLASTTTSATSSLLQPGSNLELDEKQYDGGSCQTLLCPRWVLLLFVTEFQGRAGPGVTEEVLTTVVGVAVKVDINVKEELGWIMELEKSLVCGK